jgi:hypothetical protein
MKYPEQEHCAFCPTAIGTTEAHGDDAVSQNSSKPVIA